MPNFYPFYYPYSRNRYYNYSRRGNHSNYSAMNSSSLKESIQAEDTTKKEENRTTSSSGNTISDFLSFLPTSLGPLNFHPEALSNQEKPLFELFGIELFLDDIIIICLLFFLYSEGVEDQMLYLSLIVLLFS